MELKVYNNLTRNRETFSPQNKRSVKFYSCGPTTYDYLHVGNARALVVGDLMYRTLKVIGYDVTFVRNFTDVDDKIIDAAKKRGIDPLVHAQEFVQECLTDMRELNMLTPTHTPKVSETMPEIISMIEDLISNGAAYVVNGEVLFHVPSKSDYGKLSRKDLDGLVMGHRVEVEKHKKHPSDFVLWKPAKPDEPFWSSPWGNGRPGWHIECSAMAKKFLGKTIDLHHGGVDLIFPHHENEIAQSESANKCPFCQCWLHNEFLNFSHEKMSKSLGNVVTIRSFSKQYSGLVLRYLLLSVQYRAKLDWSNELIEKSVNEMKKLHEFLVEFEREHEKDVSSKISSGQEITKLEDYYKNIVHELCQDFNSAAAIAQFFVFMKYAKSSWGTEIANDQWWSGAQKVIELVSSALGIFHQNPEMFLKQLHELKMSHNALDTAKIENLIEQRLQARKNKEFATSDLLRKELEKCGVKIKDNPDGTTSWEPL
jgi:cysteinyl-tRNA synthetase